MSEIAVVGPEGGELSDLEKRERLIQLVVDSVASEHSKRAYRTGLEQFFAWWERDASGLPFSRALAQRYRSYLGGGKRNRPRRLTSVWRRCANWPRKPR